ncbi:MAG: ATP-dependent helicase [Candidatus Binatia bacterium]|nr:ATP-dependent helicase [Candidatus Binatia bacterium]
MATYTIKRGAGDPSRWQIDYRGELNEAQHRAATTLDGPVLVVAGAGSGKTRTLTYRVARLVEGGVPARSILLLTFTRRAASEMLRRAEGLLPGGELGAVTGGTFHSFSNTVLRRYGGLFGWPEKFTILDRSDSEDTLQLVRTRLGLDRKERRFPRKSTLARIFSTATNKGVTIEDLVETDHAHLLDDVEDMLRCHEQYVSYKTEHQLLDYDDLLLSLRDRLAEHPDFGERLRSVYRYVMVDEYQDTNALQAEIVERMVGPTGNVMAVGDDAQSIYGFRGADVGNMLRFPERFPGAQVITLEENYRSSQAILDLTNVVIEKATERYSKTLFTSRGPGPTPLLIPAPDERWQSLFVRQRLLELREEGVSLSDMAVLFRSSFHSFDLELELARSGVPFVKRGGFRFVETAHVKDVVAHLRVLDNPRDVVSWHRLLLLLEGVGPRAAETVVDWLLEGGRGPGALADPPSGPVIRRRVGDALRQLGVFFAGLDPQRHGPAELVQAVVDQYRGTLERVHRDDAPKRMRDLEQFVVLSERFQDLSELLTDVALEPPNDSVGDVMAVDAGEDEQLTLSTVHSAKGLEWDAVFVISALEGRFPSQYSVEDEDIEEERRLMYVACTRARNHLHLSYPTLVHDRQLGPVPSRVSRFLDDLPPGLLEAVRLVDEEEGEEF